MSQSLLQQAMQDLDRDPSDIGVAEGFGKEVIFSFATMDDGREQVQNGFELISVMAETPTLISSPDFQKKFISISEHFSRISEKSVEKMSAMSDCVTALDEVVARYQSTYIPAAEKAFRDNRTTETTAYLAHVNQCRETLSGKKASLERLEDMNLRTATQIQEVADIFKHIRKSF